jgi:hypothetical protein
MHASIHSLPRSHVVVASTQRSGPGSMVDRPEAGVGFLSAVDRRWEALPRAAGRDLDAGPSSDCRYDLTGNTSGVCPECGTPVAGKRSWNNCPELSQWRFTFESNSSLNWKACRLHGRARFGGSVTPRRPPTGSCGCGPATAAHRSTVAAIVEAHPTGLASLAAENRGG